MRARMWLALIPTLLWAGNAVVSARCVQRLGAVRTNRWRLSLAVSVLGLWVILVDGLPEHPAAWGWLLASGAIGLGLGDLAMLGAYRSIGPRLGALLLLCLAVPISGVLEWLWLDNPISAGQVGLITVILFGVGLAMWPGRGGAPNRPARVLVLGIVLGVVAAIGQGVGSVLTRVANAAAEADGVVVSGASAAWQRMLGGLACTLIAERLWRSAPGQPPLASTGEAMVPTSRPGGSMPTWALIGIATLLGPVVGLSMYQLALREESAALVNAVTSLTPVAVIPLAWALDGDRPGWRGIVGGLVACAACVALVSGVL